MVPAWQFIGSKTRTDTNCRRRDGSPEDDAFEDGKTFIILNALDGSVVDFNYYESNRMELLKTVGTEK
jgi:hypothetical protein